jgi:hypothetical protein
MQPYISVGVMRTLSRDEFCRVIGLTPDTYDVWRVRGHVALAFGCSLPPAYGAYQPLDLVGMALVEAFADFLGRVAAAAIVRQFWDVWLDAVRRVEWDQPPQKFVFMVGKRGDLIGQKPLLIVSGGTPDEVRGDVDELPPSDQPLITIQADMRGIIAKVREAATLAGVELGDEPFFLEKWHERHETMMAEAARVREESLRRLRAYGSKRSRPNKGDQPNARQTPGSARRLEERVH